MATTYTKRDLTVDAVTTDGTNVGMASLVAAYPTFMSIQRAATGDGVKEKLVENFTVPAPSAAVKEKLVENFTVPAQAAATYETLTITVTGPCTTSGDILVGPYLSLFGIGTPATIAVVDTDDAAAVATKIRASTLTGYTWSGSGTTCILTNNTAGNTINALLASEGTTGVTLTQNTVQGSFAGAGLHAGAMYTADVTSIQAGSFNVYYNSASPVTITVEGTETADAVLDLIVAATHTGYTVSNEGDGGALLIEQTTCVTSAIPISISAGTSGIVFTDAIIVAGRTALTNGIVAGDISVLYNAAAATHGVMTLVITGPCTASGDFMVGTQTAPVAVPILNTDNAAAVATKIRASTVTGYTWSGSGTTCILTDNGTGNSWNTPGAYEGTTGVTLTQNFVQGTYAGAGLHEAAGFSADVTGIQAGSFNVYYNSASPTTITVQGTESADAVFGLIAAASHTGYSITNVGAGAALVIEQTTSVTNAIPITISAATSGIVFTGLFSYAGSTPSGDIVPVAIANGDTSTGISDKIAAAVIAGYTATTPDDKISLECDTAGARTYPLSISFGSTGVTANTSVLTAGEDAHGNIVPGNISVFYNSASPTLVAIAQDDSSTDIAGKIVATGHAGYTVTVTGDSVSIECNTAGAQVIPLSITFGTTGVTENTSTFTPGEDPSGTDGVMLILKEDGEYLNAYATNYIVVSPTRQVWTKAAFEAAYV